VVPFAELLEEILELIAEDAEALDCVAEVRHARTIVQRGSSSDQQLAVYNSAIAAGAAVDEALAEVVRFLVRETAAGL
jgi:glutamate---cysteine ligase / carboxylate-amine ligase